MKTCFFGKGWLASLALVVLLGSMLSNSLRADTASASSTLDRQTNLVEKISAQLQLAAEQKVKVEPILKESFAKRKAVIERYRGQSGLKAWRSMRKELDSIRQETDEKLATILSKDQMKAYQKLRSEMKAELRETIRERRKTSP
jgi:hypothetical protein